MNGLRSIVERNDRFLRVLMAGAAKGWTHRVGARWARSLTACCSILAMSVAYEASAHQDPPGCSASGANATPFQFPDETAKHGDKVCVGVEIWNGSSLSCNAEADVDLILGDESIVPVLKDALLQRGDFFICPSADPRCVTPSNCVVVQRKMEFGAASASERPPCSDA